jgi:hypothetical protein
MRRSSARSMYHTGLTQKALAKRPTVYPREHHLLCSRLAMPLDILTGDSAYLGATAVDMPPDSPGKAVDPRGSGNTGARVEE